MSSPTGAGEREGVGRDSSAGLRLLVVTQHFWPESFRINSFVEALRDAGADVTVLTGQPNYPEGKVFPGYRWWRAGRERHPVGYEMIRVPLMPRGRAGHVRLALNYLSFVLSGAVIGPWMLRGRKFDAILVYGTSPIFQAFAAWPQRSWACRLHPIASRIRWRSAARRRWRWAFPVWSSR